MFTESEYLKANEAYIAGVRDNDATGKIEQYEITRDAPEIFSAYIGKDLKCGMGVDRIIGTSYEVTTWTGAKICCATKGSEWRVNSYIGSHMAQFYARLKGREYTGRGFGEGMCITFRETAQSKRDNPREPSA
jgi:hypothetical protein